uniref:Uncharacterized protein n=1 Tax=Anopheles dirus TaxID=7168 RepID=A0A182NYN0_9DIPT
MYQPQHVQQTQQLQPPNQQQSHQHDQVRWKVKTHEPFAAPMHSPQSTSEASRKQPYPRPQYY